MTIIQEYSKECPRALGTYFIKCPFHCILIWCDEYGKDNCSKCKNNLDRGKVKK